MKIMKFAYAEDHGFIVAVQRGDNAFAVELANSLVPTDPARADIATEMDHNGADDNWTAFRAFLNDVGADNLRVTYSTQLSAHDTADAAVIAFDNTVAEFTADYHGDDWN